MSESPAPPGAPHQFRGKTLTPVSPKPQYFPSPSNIPILEASMDPAFNENVNQSMQQQQQEQRPLAHEFLPSMAQHTLPNMTLPNEARGNDTRIEGEDMGLLQGIENSQGMSDGQVEQTIADSTLNPAAVESVAPGTFSISSEKPAFSENVSLDPSIAATSTLENVGIDASKSIAADTEAAGNAQAAPGAEPKSNDPLHESTNNGIDYAALLANISSMTSSIAPADSNTIIAPTQTASTVISPISTLPSNPNLPPKPPTQGSLPSNLDLLPDDDIRSLHPHSQNENSAYRSQSLANLTTNDLSPHSQAYHTPITAPHTVSGSAIPSQGHRAVSPSDEGELPFDAHAQQLYDQFIQFERSNVQEGQWEKFPNGSRLFIGNLLTERVTKKDVFRKFYKYGQLAQISLKQAYGFVQYMDATACATALAAEQGTKLRGREIHLEISKPAKSTRQDRNRDNRRRSRSPDYSRGDNRSSRIDRYSSNMSPRDRDNRRSRDDWRPGRSPSPRRGYGNGSRIDRYDGRRKSRSRSPPGGRGRYETPPQLHREEIDLPWRQPHEVPDIQVIVVDNIDQEYIRWVDQALKSRGARVDVLVLNSRLSDEVVVRRQIIEGVLAVVHLYRADRLKNRIPLRLFKRTSNNANVSFDQYVDLEPTIAAEIVLAAKAAQAAQSQPPPPPPQPYAQHRSTHAQQESFSAAPYPSTYGYQEPPHLGHNPAPSSGSNDISRIISSLGTPGLAPLQQQNNPDLSRIMAGLHQNGPHTPGQRSTTGLTPDVARLLGTMGQVPPPSGLQMYHGDTSHIPQQQQHVNHPIPGSFAATLPTPATANPAVGSAVSGMAGAGNFRGGGGMGVHPPTSQTTPDIQQLLANLTNYKPG